MTNLIGDFRTAGKRVRIETMYNGLWHGGRLQDMIQALADEGYDCLGKINEFMPTGTIAMSSEDFLFVKAP